MTLNAKKVTKTAETFKWYLGGIQYIRHTRCDHHVFILFVTRHVIDMRHSCGQTFIPYVDKQH